MFTIFIPVEGKVKYDCTVFKLWVWVYTAWHPQSAITFKDAIDVLFTGSRLVVGVKDKIEGKKNKLTVVDNTILLLCDAFLIRSM